MSDLGININNTQYGQTNYMAQSSGNTDTSSNTKQSSIWDTLITQAGPMLDGVAKIIYATKGGNNSGPIYYGDTSATYAEPNNQKTWLMIGGGAILLIAVLFLIFKK